MRYLEAYRDASAHVIGPDRTFENLQEWLHSWSEKLKRLPDPPQSVEPESTVVTLDPQFIEILKRSNIGKGGLKEGENRLPPRYTKMLEVAQPIALLLEDQEKRTGLAYGLGFLYMFLEPLVSDLRHQQFGADPLDLNKIRTLVGMILEFLAKFVRGRWEPPKGRINSELLAVINLINSHQILKLTPEELRQAVALAGITVPEGDTWRMWLHRAKKRGLIPEVPVLKRLPDEVEVSVRPDGSLDLESLDPATKRLLRRAVRRVKIAPGATG